MMMNGKSWSDPENITWLLFAAVIVAVYLFALDVPLMGPDEPRYTQVAREMFERGDLVTPTLGGHNWFEKPVLLYWLQICSFALFGISEAAARFGSALFGLGTIASLFILGRCSSESMGKISNFGILFDNTDSKLKTENSKPQSSLAPWFALVAATSLGLLVFSRGASFDIIITFPVTASLVGFFVFDRQAGPSSAIRFLSLSVFYFFIGLGLIAKGLIGAVFPLAIVSFYFLLSRRWPQKTFVLSLFWGGVISLSVAGLWYLPMFLQHGWEFWDEFIVQHHFQRYTSNKYRHPGPFWYFWIVLPLMTIPWLPLFAASVWKALRRTLFRGKRRSPLPDFVDEYPDLVKFAFAWMLVPLVFFSLSGSKLPGYIVPALPPALVLTALFVRDIARRGPWRSLLVKLVAFLMLASIASILAFALPRFAEDDSVRKIIRTANSEGYRDAKILAMHTTSHNAEFYGRGRLVRDTNGEQWRFLGVGGVAEYMLNNGGKPVLVLIPHAFEPQLTSSDLVRTKTLGRTGELSIVAVQLYDSGENKNED